MKQKFYIAIDLKSFYASVECIERGLDPLTTNLLVADASRTEKTICLAVSPSLKAFGIPGRPRLFEAVQKVREANALRRMKAPGQKLVGKTYDARLLASDPTLAIDYITAPPRMAHYMEHSAKIYEIYLKYIAPEDIITTFPIAIYLRIGARRSSSITASVITAPKTSITIPPTSLDLSQRFSA